MKQHLLKFHPILKPTIWGGQRISGFKNAADSKTDIGESWEVSSIKGSESVVAEGVYAGRTLPSLVEEFGARLIGSKWTERCGNVFPLLVKIIDASADLSIQVHPNDALAIRRHGCGGKSEMWYILDSEPGAKIRNGFCKAVATDEFLQSVKDKKLPELINTYSSRPGDVYQIPAGRVHSIGGGNLLVEIQQASDITYRIYDYDRRDASGRPRQLHLEESIEAINFSGPEGCAPIRGLKSNATVKGDAFTLSRVSVKGEERISIPTGSFLIAICIKGAGSISCPAANPNPTVIATNSDPTPKDEESKICQGETLLIAAEATTITAQGEMDLLIAGL